MMAETPHQKGIDGASGPVRTGRRRLARYALWSLPVLLLLPLIAFLAVTWRRDAPVRPAGRTSPIADAARTGDFSKVNRLLGEGADANLPAADGASALLWAAYHGRADVVRALIEAGANADAANRYGVTPLLQASRTGDTAVIHVLLEAGANPNLAHPQGETPLMAAARSGAVEGVRLLLARGADVNATDTLADETALMWAAAEGHPEVVDVLLAAGANPNLRARVTSLIVHANADFPTGGFTALMWAARNGHAEVLQRLLERGADPTLTNGDGATATIVAIVNDRFDIAATLLDRGADPNDGSLYHAVDMHDGTTDMYALDGTRLRADHPNRLTASDLIQRLLERGADPNRPVVGQLHSTSLCCGPFVTFSPFYRAAIASDVNALELLLAKGADVAWSPARVQAQGADGSFGTNASPNEFAGWPPLRAAMRGGRGAPLANGPGVQQREGPPPFREPGSRRPLDAVKVLLDAGADVDALGPDGSAALHEAAESGQVEMVRALAKAGATLDRRNRDGRTALELAERQIEQSTSAAGTTSGDTPAPTPEGRGRSEVVAVLRELMARQGDAAPTASRSGGGAAEKRGPARVE